MAKERNNYEMPTNEDFEDLLQENLKTVKPMEFKEKEIGGQKQLFPFWNAVEPEEVHYSKDSYLNAKQKKEREMKNGKNLVQRMEDVMGNIKNTQMVDMTDVVKAPANEMGTSATTKQVTSWDSTADQPVVSDSNAAKASEDNVGAVKVQSNDLGDTKTDKQITEWDSTADQPVVSDSNAAKASEDNVGAVKVQSNDLGDTKTDKQVTSWDSSESNTEVSNATKAPKDNVGAVKPKQSDMSSTATDKQVTSWDSTKLFNGRNYGGIDFSKFM